MSTRADYGLSRLPRKQIYAIMKKTKEGGDWNSQKTKDQLASQRARPVIAGVAAAVKHFERKIIKDLATAYGASEQVPDGGRGLVIPLCLFSGENRLRGCVVFAAKKIRRLGNAPFSPNLAATDLS